MATNCWMVGKCNMASYCSSDCQAEDWPQHKDTCKLFSRKQEWRERTWKEMEKTFEDDTSDMEVD